MKNFILTHHWVNNFGANLQAFAMQSLISKYDKDIKIIDFRENWRKELISNIDYDQKELHQKFVKEYLNNTDEINSKKRLYEYIARHDARIFVGSDAMLEVPNITNIRHIRMFLKTKGKYSFFVPPYYLDKVSPSEKYIIASSMMGSNYLSALPFLKKKLRKSLLSFKKIYVRDHWTKTQIDNFLGSDISYLIGDPTIAFDWEEIKCKPNEDVASKYILIFGVHETESLINLVNYFKKNNYQIVGVRTPEKKAEYNFLDLTLNDPIGPFEWMNLIKNSSFVIGNKFHGQAIAFSCNVPGIVIDQHKEINNRKERSKMYWLCKEADLEGLYFDLSTSSDININKIINIKNSPDTIQKLKTYKRKNQALYKDFFQNIFLKS